jgi:hypothetical protein
MKQPPKPPNQNYDFYTQKKLGLQGEERLDSFFCRWYIIEEVPIELQREGVDRFYIPRRGEVTFPRLVEYKTDFQDTGNAYVETHSVIRAGQREIKGWLHTSKADWLIYFMAVDEIAFVINFTTLRQAAITWESEQLCKRRDCLNRNYKGSGLIVPIRLMLRVSYAVFKVPYCFEF